MLGRRRRRRNDWYAPLDEELFERVLEIVAAEVREPEEAVRVSVTRTTGRGNMDGFWGGIAIRPDSPDSSPMWLGVQYDTITVCVGSTDASQEIWTTVSEDWQLFLAQVIACVRDGRYSERVRKGLIFALRVDMRFAGVPSGEGRKRSDDWTPGYASTLASSEAPDAGDRRVQLSAVVSLSPSVNSTTRSGAAIAATATVLSNSPSKS